MWKKAGTMLVRSALREYRNWIADSRYWSGYVPRDGDIIIATAPKCGTTWMQQIASSLVFGDANVRPLPMSRRGWKPGSGLRRRRCVELSHPCRTAAS